MANDTSADDIPSRYDAAASDPALYAAWESAGVFRMAADQIGRAHV